MAIVSPRQVSSGYFRNNLYVVLGLNVLAVLVAVSAPAESMLRVWPPLVGALAAYAGAVSWLYENPRAGRIALAVVAAASLAGSYLATSPAPSETTATLLAWQHWCDPPTAGLLLGATMAAMLLGHWYLNSPGMKLAPLRGLIALMLLAVIARAIVAGAGACSVGDFSSLPGSNWWMLVLRWATGLVGAAGTAVAAWLTLRIPNTQSATGILYVGVIFVFLGELCSQLLSSGSGVTL